MYFYSGKQTQLKQSETKPSLRLEQAGPPNCSERSFSPWHPSGFSTLASSSLKTGSLRTGRQALKSTSVGGLKENHGSSLVVGVRTKTDFQLSDGASTRYLPRY